MKHKFKKLACLLLSLIATSLTSCNKNTETNFKTEIKTDFYNQMLNLTYTKQIKNKVLWKKFVDVFRDKEDSKQIYGKWRGEFWGKMMRGATLCYRHSQDEELYQIMTETVNDLLSTQEKNGRFSTYDLNAEFTDWDLWGRKYVMTSLLHYYEICKDQNLKTRIIDALKKHADYIVKHVGPNAGQKDILDCGGNVPLVQGLNAASILEPFVNLYEVTNEQKYLDFAQYIIKSGGSKAGDMIAAAFDDTKLPHEYPVQKAYEMLSFFEGVYRFGRLNNDQSLVNTAVKFFDKVFDNEITVIGSGGNHEELFDRGIDTQINSHDPQSSNNRFGIELCVTVTWMRILNVLYENTKDIKYYERFAQTAMNAFLGNLNIYDQKSYSQFDQYCDLRLPFDSYSPLCYDSRGVLTAGLAYFKNPTDVAYYGCCVCNAPASIGLIGMNYSRHFDNKLYLNEYYPTDITSNKGNINIDGSYLNNGRVNITLNCNSDDELLLRIPSWANNPKVTINNEVKNVTTNSYYSAGAIKNIKNISLELNPVVKKELIGSTTKKACFFYGPYVLAVDENINAQNFTSNEYEGISGNNILPSQLQLINAESDEFVRFKVPYQGKDLIFTNYSSAGRKHYKGDKSNTRTRLTVFLKNT